MLLRRVLCRRRCLLGVGVLQHVGLLHSCLSCNIKRCAKHCTVQANSCSHSHQDQHQEPVLRGGGCTSNMGERNERTQYKRGGEGEHTEALLKHHLSLIHANKIVHSFCKAQTNPLSNTPPSVHSCTAPDLFPQPPPLERASASAYQ